MNKSRTACLTEDESDFCERVYLGMLTVNTEKRLLAIIDRLVNQTTACAARDCNVGLAEAENINEYAEGYEVENK